MSLGLLILPNASYLNRKRSIMSKSNILCILFCLLANPLVMSQDLHFPAKHWMSYDKAADAGFDELQLAEVKQQFEKQGGSTMFVVQAGKVLAAWGSPDRRYLQASIRKSYLSALFGIFAEEGQIDLQQNLESLAIDDIQALTSTEKKAKIIDLLRAKSGIYLPAAFSPKGMAKYLPARGSHDPGTFWYYNNWDFNALSTIFQQQTQQDLFTAFHKRIAAPLQMEDFRLFDTYYRFEKDKSIHPAYLFKMSARDMARFGLLFLRAGKWKSEQLIPAEWVTESTRVHTAELGRGFQGRGGYGLLWWIAPPIDGNTLYYASGSGGQRLYVIPEQDMVIVHLVDTYQNKDVADEAILSLVKRLLQAKTKEANSKANLETLAVPEQQKTQALDLVAAKQLIGEYQHPFLKRVGIALQEKDLILQTGVGTFKLSPRGHNQYLIEDIQFPIVFEAGQAAQKGTSRSVVNDQRIVERVIFYY